MDTDTPDAATPPWSVAILVCAKCAGKRPDGLAVDGRTEIRAWFRERLAAAGAIPAVRVAETTCLAVCPEGGGITALLVSGGAATTACVLRDDREREALLNRALRRLPDVRRPS